MSLKTVIAMGIIVSSTSCFTMNTSTIKVFTAALLATSGKNPYAAIAFLNTKQTTAPQHEDSDSDSEFHMLHDSYYAQEKINLYNKSHT